MLHPRLPCAASSRPEHVLVKPQSSDVLAHHYPYVRGYRHLRKLVRAVDGGVVEDHGSDNPDDLETVVHGARRSRSVVGRVDAGVEDP